MEKKELERLGLKLEEEINIDLYNAIPTELKCANIYHFIKGHGYKEDDAENAISDIKTFFRQRKPSDIQNLFRKLFKIPFDGSFISELTLNYKTSVIPQQTIEHISKRVFDLLKNIDIERYGISLIIIQKALNEAYNPHYTEPQHKISSSMFWKKVKKIGGHELTGINELDQLFWNMNPKNIEKTNGVEEKDGDFSGMENGDEENSSDKAHVGNKSSSRGNGEGQSSLTNSIKIKESEYMFASNVDLLFTDVKYPNVIDMSFFKNRDILNCHPLVKNLHNSLANYNVVRSDLDFEDDEVLEGLETYKIASQMFAREIISQYNSNIKNQITVVNNSIKKMNQKEPIEARQRWKKNR